VETGVFVLGMDRSGTSTVARLVSLLGLHPPRSDDLVQARDTNPKGVWESASLVVFNRRVLKAIGTDERFPAALAPGWERDARLAALRGEAPAVFATAFPEAPWVWKDPLLCLSFAFWREALDVRPVIVLVNRNPLEIAASALRAWGRPKIYGLALWERYLRQALTQISELPVIVTNYGDAVADPLAWCGRMQAFLCDSGVGADAQREGDVLEFVDAGLRHSEFTHDDVSNDADVSAAQRALFLSLDGLAGAHAAFVPPELPAETPTNEALFAERRETFRVKGELERELEQVRRSRWSTRIRARARRLRERAESNGGPPEVADPRPPLHVLHIGKTGGTALKHVLMEQQDSVRYRLLFRGHDVGLADVPRGELFMFLIRDPLSRFVSAFNGRLREDRPRYHYPWREEEKVAFAIFSTPDQLATALSSPEETERLAAEQAMQGIGHVNAPYTTWFRDEEALRARADDLFFVGFQERLDEDFQLLKEKLGLPADASLPGGDTEAHRTPEGFDRHLSESAQANLRRWYSRDIALYELCRELAGVTV